MSEVLLVAVAGGPRLSDCAGSLTAAGHSVRIRDWRDLDGPLPSHDVVRIDSPSDDPALDADLVRLGGGPLTDVAGGELVPGPAWVRGLGRLLGRLDALTEPARRLYDTATVLAMFDKAVTQHRLAEAGVPVPPFLPEVSDWDCLRTAARDRGWAGVFVKVRHGSSGAGQVAVRWSGTRVAGYTTVALDGGRMWNRSRVRRVTDEREIACLVRALGPHGLHVERWIPKLAMPGGHGDVRVVLIGGRASHVLVRVSGHPFTNLHLGAARGDIGWLRARLGEPGWARMTGTAEAAAACFPAAHHCGVDLALDLPGRPHVLELNAFGDYHPGVVDDAGQDTYTAELAVPQPLPVPS